MHNYLLIISFLCLYDTSPALSDDKPAKKEIKQFTYNEEEAKKIAEKFFLKKNGKKVTKYSIEVLTDDEQDKNYWYFFFDGKEEFARPGYYWIIKVNKTNGKTEIRYGE